MKDKGTVMAIIVIAAFFFNPFISLAVAAVAGAYFGFSHNKLAASKMLVVSCLILLWLFAGGFVGSSGGSS